MNHNLTSVLLRQILSERKEEYLSFGELLKSLSNRGFAILLVVFTLPNCVPIPVPPGVSTIFSLPLLFLSLQMCFGLKAPWLPAWIERRTIPRTTLNALIETATPRIEKLETFLKPRMGFVTTQLGARLIGFAWLLFSISIAVPIPMTNFLPGLGILISSLGLLGRDGVIVIFGWFVGFLGIALTSAILLYGAKFIQSIFPWF